MRTLLIGGHETTASTLAWILERVTRHPDVLSRLEAAALEGDDDYIDAVIKEAMRLRPVFPITARLASEDFTLGDLTIPADTLIVPHITLVHRRPDLYPDPLAFRPQRFLDARAGNLRVDTVRRRTKTLHRRGVLTHRDPDRAAHNASPRSTSPDESACRTHRTTHGYDRPRPRCDRHARTSHRLNSVDGKGRTIGTLTS